MHCDRFYFVHCIQFSQLNDYTSSKVAPKSEVRAHNSSAYLSIDTRPSPSMTRSRQRCHPPRWKQTQNKKNLVCWGGGYNRTRSGRVPEQVWTRHRPATGTDPVNFCRCERNTNEWNGTGTGLEREPEQVWTRPYRQMGAMKHVTEVYHIEFWNSGRMRHTAGKIVFHSGGYVLGWGSIGPNHVTLLSFRWETKKNIG